MTLPSFGQQYRNGSHTGPNPPTHCQSCGRPMRLYQTLGFRWTPRFDSNGNPNIVHHAECTASRLLRIFGIHDHATQDYHGDSPWVE